MKNKKIILTVGIPASGKGTWREKFLRENSNIVCVSRDEYRFMLRNEPFLDPKGEKFVTEMVEEAIIRAIKNKYNVIVDQTNVNIKYLRLLVEFCQKLADVDFKIFDLPLKVALERDAKRERSVGKVVLERMYKNYLVLFDSNFDFSTRKKLPYIAQGIKWKRDGNKPNAVIFDIDGTIAHMQGKRGSFDWNKVGVDTVDEKVRETLNVYKKAGYKIIMVTGRDGVCADDTEQWLIDNKIDFDYLFTKPENDFRKDTINKTEIYNEFIKGRFNVLCAYDDRDQAVATWRGLGIKCYQVAEGTF
jgi:predicted kinase